MLKTISSIATQIISSITGGLVQFTGPAAGTTRVITVPNENATMARTDAAQSFTGDQTLSTGNLVVSNGKGIDFSATPGTGTSELLADYEEGTWTPTVIALTGTITSYTSSGKYTKIGRQVIINYDFTITNNGTGAGVIAMQGLPFSVSSAYTAVGVCRDIALSGNNGVVLNTATATLNMQTIVNTYIGGTGARVIGTLCYTA